MQLTESLNFGWKWVTPIGLLNPNWDLFYWVVMGKSPDTHNIRNNKQLTNRLSSWIYWMESLHSLFYIFTFLLLNIGVEKWKFIFILICKRNFRSCLKFQPNMCRALMLLFKLLHQYLIAIHFIPNPVAKVINKDLGWRGDRAGGRRERWRGWKQAATIDGLNETAKHIFLELYSICIVRRRGDRIIYFKDCWATEDANL